MACLHIPEIPYGEFSARLHDQGASRRLLLGASIDVTERCNLRCAHCYINRPAGDRQAQKRELTFSHWAYLLDEMAAAGCLWLLMSGGEPLLRPDFREIYLHAKRLGMIITLFTNGTLVTPELADFLREWPPFEVEITVYGRTKATYEAVTRAPGSYENCLRGIDLLLARQIPLELKTLNGAILEVEPRPGTEIRVGEVAFYRNYGGGLVAHRVVRKRFRRGRTIFLIKGDAPSCRSEGVYSTQILGRVVRVEQEGHCLDLDCLQERVLGKIMAYLSLALPYLRRTINLLGDRLRLRLKACLAAAVSR